MQLLRKGDRVRVMATVEWDQRPEDERISLRLDTGLETTRADAAAVEFLHHEFRPGDRVDGRHRPIVEGPATIIATHGDEAWIQVGRTTTTMKLAALVHADGEIPAIPLHAAE